MTNRIQRLPESLIRKIAAGEVIERPASVVKELVENALDAGAARVWIEVEEAGRQAIRVVDDGEGMTARDVELSVERHATSKMRTPTDLFTIQTLGFRGEALASIAAVARLTVETRRADEEQGTRLVVEGGIRRELTATARDVGTTIDVRGLFYNTPARRKFLRHPDTEMRHVTQAVVLLAASRPEVAFRLAHAGREALELLPGTRTDRARQLLAADAEGLLSVAGEDPSASAGSQLRVEGLITVPDGCRRTRTRQYTVVRQRPIHAPQLTKALYAGYGSLLPAGRHPQFVLWLDLDPRRIDVNVHPTKREVRFSHEPELRKLIQQAVREAVRVPEARAFVYPTGGEAGAPPGVAETPAPAPPPADAGPRLGPGDATAEAEVDPQQMSLSLLPAARLSGAPLKADDQGRQALAEARRSSRIWQVHDKYLLVAIRDGLLIVDQHVAHERVRFEEVLADLETESAASQQLLIPLTVPVSAVELETFRASEALFARLGFGVREFGPSTLVVDAIPPGLRNWEGGDLFYQILSDLIEELEARSEAHDAMAASMACHTSIRAGERLSADEMETLVARLLGAREPFACPHGRPILIKVPLLELDRLFHRV